MKYLVFVFDTELGSYTYLCLHGYNGELRTSVKRALGGFKNMRSSPTKFASVLSSKDHSYYQVYTMLGDLRETTLATYSLDEKSPHDAFFGPALLIVSTNAKINMTVEV